MRHRLDIKDTNCRQLSDTQKNHGEVYPTESAGCDRDLVGDLPTECVSFQAE